MLHRDVVVHTHPLPAPTAEAEAAARADDPPTPSRADGLAYIHHLMACGRPAEAIGDECRLALVCIACSLSATDPVACANLAADMEHMYTLHKEEYYAIAAAYLREHLARRAADVVREVSHE